MDGMAYAPTNEQGVVFLFGRLAPRLRFHIESVQTGFPDCYARRKGRRCRIEFEYRASSYRGHPPRGADVIVCWDNDWAERPREYRHLEIISLKEHVGAGPRVFAVGCVQNERGEVLDNRSIVDWSVPTRTEVGDLIVMYRTRPASEIRDLWIVRGPFYTDPSWGLTVDMRILIRLKRPVSLRELTTDQTTRALPIVRKRFQGRSDITDDWPPLGAAILKRNPEAKRALRPFLFG